ncbi:hypothetical protein [Opacimonas viscosa]|uniref:Uncharacterized protein n=1 Tax=Opacimonas viscosa TaxID=2961944 RepID=A0AA41WY40_9ALTE|nr:hypothetical protein [Opacimonas viscosa]MCP3428495.1 hypothetical protein [Opacimonas viscosa]
MNVLVMGEDSSIKGRPLNTLSILLKKLDCKVYNIFDEDTSNFSFYFNILKKVNIVIFLDYDGPQEYRVRNYAIAKLLNKKIVRWWVGSDVLFCLEDKFMARNAYDLAKFSDFQLAVSHHLVKELESLHIKSQYVPSVLDPLNHNYSKEYDLSLNLSVLVYLPSSRKVFFKYDLIHEVIKTNPGFHFHIVADETHSLSSFSNVTSYGYVEDMSIVWNKCNILLRQTKHDGLPRMALTALQLNKHVIYSWELPGCILANTTETISSALQQIKQSSKKNYCSETALDKILSPCPHMFFKSHIINAKYNFSLSKYFWAILFVLKYTLILKFRKNY